MQRLAFIASILAVPVLFVTWQMFSDDVKVVEGETGANEKAFSLVSINYQANKEPQPIDSTPFYEASLNESTESAPKDLTELKGKPVILHFWAPWCGACLSELPSFDTFTEMYGSDFHILAVTKDDKSGETIRRFYKENNIKNLSLTVDENDAMARKFNISALPSTVFLNSKGEEIGRITGPVEWKGTAGRMLTKHLSGK